MADVYLKDKPDKAPEPNDKWVTIRADGTIHLTPASSTGGVATDFQARGTGAVIRSQTDKARDFVSILDFIPVNLHSAIRARTSTTNLTTYFNAAMASGAATIYIPYGRYQITRLVVPQELNFIGDGRNHTEVRINTTADHGIELAPGNRSLIIVFKFTGIYFRYNGSGQAAGKHGLYITHKVLAKDCVWSHFTNDCGYFDSNWLDHPTGRPQDYCVFFASFEDCWFNNSVNGNGMNCRYGANANRFINCQFSRNGNKGFFHQTDGVATYGNTLEGGQCSYNAWEGYYLFNGTNLATRGLYAEYNGAPNNTNQVGDRYTNTTVDYYVGDSLSRSTIGIGTVYVSNNAAHVRAPGPGASAYRTTEVYTGGQPLKDVSLNMMNLDFGENSSSSAYIGPLATNVFADGTGAIGIRVQGTGNFNTVRFAFPGASAWAFQIHPSAIKLSNRNVDPTDTRSVTTGGMYYDTRTLQKAPRVYDGTGWRTVLLSNGSTGTPGTGGLAAAPPAAPAGWTTILVDGSYRKIPYYN